MTLDATNVRVALSGAVYSAPLLTAQPTTPSETWPVGWVDLGYISEDGVTEAYSDDSEVIKAWQGGATVRTVITSTEATFAFTCLETRKDVWETYHKGSLLTDDGATATMQVRNATAAERMFGFDVIDGTNHVRIVVARGEVSERGEIVYRNNEPVGYELTITAYPNADGVTAIKMSDADGLLSA
jgi:hypothetical protein